MRRRRSPGYRIKNKNPTQSCGELYDYLYLSLAGSQSQYQSWVLAKSGLNPLDTIFASICFRPSNCSNETHGIGIGTSFYIISLAVLICFPEFCSYLMGIAAASLFIRTLRASTEPFLRRMVPTWTGWARSSWPFRIGFNCLGSFKLPVVVCRHFMYWLRVCRIFGLSPVWANVVSNNFNSTMVWAKMVPSTCRIWDIDFLWSRIYAFRHFHGKERLQSAKYL